MATPKKITAADVAELAREHADAVRPRRSGKYTFTEALARAPWPRDYPPEHEDAFRRTYAERLVELALALKVGRSRTSGPGGETDLDRCVVYLSAEERAATQAQAKAAGLSWSAWARRKLTE